LTHSAATHPLEPFLLPSKDYIKRYVEFFKEAGLDTKDMDDYLNSLDDFIQPDVKKPA
jgi:hypothetical protein